MRQDSKAFRFSHWIAVLGGAIFVVSAFQVMAQDVAATYVTGGEIPVRSDGFVAEGKTVNIALGFAPRPGAQLMVVQNTSRGIIRGRFANLAQGQTITLTYAG